MDCGAEVESLFLLSVPCANVQHPSAKSKVHLHQRTRFAPVGQVEGILL